MNFQRVSRDEDSYPKGGTLKVPLNLLLTWPFYSLRDPYKGTPKTQGSKVEPLELRSPRVKRAFGSQGP